MGSQHRRLLLNRLWKSISKGGSLSEPHVEMDFDIFILLNIYIYIDIGTTKPY
jgi:hypothetical protein